MKIINAFLIKPNTGIMVVKTIALLSVSICVFAGKSDSSLKRNYQHQSSENIQDQISFNTASDLNTLFVHNVFGSIDVQAHNGSQVLYEVEKSIRARTEKGLKLGEKEIDMKVVQVGTEMHLYLDSPYASFDVETGRYSHNDNGMHHKKRVDEYRYLLDFEIKVPSNTNLVLVAINDGDVNVNGVKANDIKVTNINGAINLSDVSGALDTNAINKNITVSYESNPEGESFFESINGDINITFAKKPNAEIFYKTSNGDFYTNFDVVNAGPVVHQNQYKTKKGIKYKYNSESHIIIGSGMNKFNLNTLNGDIYVK